MQVLRVLRVAIAQTMHQMYRSPAPLAITVQAQVVLSVLLTFVVQVNTALKAQLHKLIALLVTTLNLQVHHQVMTVINAHQVFTALVLDLIPVIL